jgi:hypothetical protein
MWESSYMFWPFTPILRAVLDKQKHNNTWKAETSRTAATCLYIILSKYSAVVGKYAVTSLTAQNKNIFNLQNPNKQKLFTVTNAQRKSYMNNYCIFFFGQKPLWRWLKEAKTCRRTTTCLYIIVCHCAATGVYIVNCLIAWNIDNFEPSSV